MNNYFEPLFVQKQTFIGIPLKKTAAFYFIKRKTPKQGFPKILA